MFYLKNPLEILLVTVVVGIASATVQAQQVAPKKAVPDFKFEGKSYRVDCYDKTKGGCEQLIEHLKSLQRPRESALPIKPWNEHVRSASL